MLALLFAAALIAVILLALNFTGEMVAVVVGIVALNALVALLRLRHRQGPPKR